jgi:hypothetical protein
MSKPRDPAKEQFWRQTLAAWQDSGLSVTAFCRQRQLQLQSFFRWRKLLAQRDQPAVSAPTTAPSAAVAAAPAFVPVRLRHRLAEAGQHPFEVVLAGSRLLRVGSAFDPAALRQLLGVLEQSPC